MKTIIQDCIESATTGELLAEVKTRSFASCTACATLRKLFQVSELGVGRCHFCESPIIETFIVVKRGRAREHLTIDEATAEAERLVKKQPGDTFGVFRRVAVVAKDAKMTGEIGGP